MLLIMFTFLIKKFTKILFISVTLLLSACSTFSEFDEDNPLVQKIIKTRQCENCQLNHINLSNLDLTGVNFAKSKLDGANFENSILNNAKLSYTDLRNANFTGAELFAVNLRGADLRGVNLIDVRLAGSDLRETDMSDIYSDEQLDLMELTGVRLNGAKFKDNVICSGFPPKEGWGCVIKKSNVDN